MASSPEPSGIRSDSRTPDADSTRYAAEAVPADEYGCQTWSRSKAIKRSKSVIASAISAGLPVDRALRGPAPREDLHLHPPTALAAEPRRLQRERTVAGEVVSLLPRLTAAAAPLVFDRHTRPALRTSRSAP